MSPRRKPGERVALVRALAGRIARLREAAKVADAQAQGRGRMARAGGTHELQLARRIDASSRVQLNL